MGESLMPTKLEGPVDGIVFVGIDAGRVGEVPPNWHPLSVSLEGVVLALIKFDFSWVLILRAICPDLHPDKESCNIQPSLLLALTQI